MTKFKISFDRANCIGAGACVAVHPEAYEMKDDGKPDLAGSDIRNTELQEITVDLSPQQLEQHLLAAKSCPVLVIHITNLETGEKLV